VIVSIKRRQIMLGLSAAMLPLPYRRAHAAAAPLALLVAGPQGGQTSRWGDACAQALSPCFAGAPPVITAADGGLDGVTGANRLDALVVPDGRTAAILPGAALIAWLTGDDRVHFDPTHWVPIMAGTNSGVLVVRLNGMAPNLATLRARSPLRLAADQPQSNDLAALIALERMGVKIQPVFGLRDMDAKTQAFVTGAADAVFVAGEGVPEDIAPLAANGGVPIFCLGAPTCGPNAAPDPLFPGLPDVIAFGGAAASVLDGAYHAAAAAARLDFLVVLPKLTDPDAVAQWRSAATGAITAPAFAAAASASSITLQPAPVAAAQLAAVNLGPTGQAGLQALLSTSFGWQPG
jgi:hypothetical protein